MIGPLCYRKESPCPDPAELRVIPARKRLGAGEAVILEVELRLEQDFDLVAVDGTEQVRFQLRT